jgi:glucan-binding YG repeat protein
MKKKVLLALLLGFTTFTVFSNQSDAAWQIGSQGWWNTSDNAAGYSIGWEKINDRWYFFDNNGWMLTGWYEVSGEWYYSNPGGDMVSNAWIGDYYLTASGMMAKDTWIGNYYVDTSGKWIPNQPSGSKGWVQQGNQWYYYKEDGSKASGWLNLNGTWYYLNANGVMATGWLNLNGTWYYLNSDGAMASGWLNLNGIWYAFEPSGTMYANRWYGNYYLTASGAMAVNSWVDNNKYYVGADGVWIPGKTQDGNTSDSGKKGWVKSGNDWNYYHENGTIATGWVIINGSYYYFTPTGKMLTGWIHFGDKYYYLNEGGDMRIGWFVLDNKWYYCHPDGLRATGWTDIEGQRYFLDTTGKMLTGWIHFGSNYYYLNNSGQLQRNWFQINNKWYYSKDNGLRVTNTWIDGYYITETGAMATGSIIIDGVTYNFDANGNFIGKVDSSAIGNKIVTYAKRFVGNPYVYGGTSLTNGADCSGFVYTVFKDHGILLQRVASDQAAGPSASLIAKGYAAGKTVTINTMIPGDLIFYANGGYIDHVGIYIGDNKIIHASNPRTGITITDYRYKTPAKIVRYF